MSKMEWKEFEKFSILFRQPVIHVEDQVFLQYFGDACTICGQITLPESGTYRVDVIDVWNMTRKTVLEGVFGNVNVPLPGKPGMAVLSVKETQN